MNGMILDPCCGSRMMWFNPEHQGVLFGDIRSEEHTLCDGRALKITPDVLMDFRLMPFPDNTFNLIAFDPPHLRRAGRKSWLKAKYGILGDDWQEDLRRGFSECFRVLRPHGVLIFKWNETQIKVSEILVLSPYPPPIWPHVRQAGEHPLDHFYEARTKMTDYKLVPVEPTGEMIKAGCGPTCGSPTMAVGAYKFMIAAAPAQPSPAESDNEAVRNATIEECAKVCEQQSRSRWNCDRTLQARLDAKEIRALKSQPAQPSDTEMLDWLSNNHASVIEQITDLGPGKIMVGIGKKEIAKSFVSTRDAIKAAMQAQEVEK